ncbi:hypothetical protein [Synechococcus sp. BS55D]|uniref:hypothetical protein n=1 Tax=Synechococcus sp. BS55D TaxID=2055943 RepID=UPI001040589B|nr:hypothetical protein [Synechococcus sp. BS55D]TCD56501.1 hypothetical protein CWE16_09110 [Synechococcus sp. BS55D]
MPSSSLQQAFAQLMQSAPSALFPKARRLYLNKFPLDGRDSTSALRLFVANEQVEEQIETASDNATDRSAVLTIRPLKLALVHWLQAEPASDAAMENYFRSHWQLDAPALEAQAEAWFREGGHQSLFTAPEGLIWERRSSLPAT